MRLIIRAAARAAVLVLLAVGAVLTWAAVTAGPAGAAVLEVVEDSTEPVGNSLTIGATLLAVVLGILAPIVTGILVRPTNPPVVKILAAGVVATIINAVQQAVMPDGSAVLTGPWLVSLVVILAAQVASYFGVWQPLASGQLNEKLGPGVIPVESRPAT
jgi:hypothetical protein